jgi:branched-chain amino acid transport system ATP-binding protein
MLQISKLDVLYGRAHILRDVSLEVGQGEVAALLGRNGAGKSTTLKAIMGLTPARSGSVHLAGRSMTGLEPYEIAQAGLGYVPEERRIFTGLTVGENLEVGRRAPRAGIPVWTPERLFELFPGLGEMQGREGGRMSGGEQQMLAIARCLMGNPSCILLDEPAEGLAPVIVDRLAAAIQSLKREGVAVLLSEQNWQLASGVADRAYIIEKGQIRFAGSMAELVASPEVRAAFLAP